MTPCVWRQLVVVWKKAQTQKEGTSAHTQLPASQTRSGSKVNSHKLITELQGIEDLITEVDYRCDQYTYKAVDCQCFLIHVPHFDFLILEVRAYEAEADADVLDDVVHEDIGEDGAKTQGGETQQIVMIA